MAVAAQTNTLEWDCRCRCWVKRVAFVMSAVCPVYPKQQTSPDTVGRFWATNGRCREANRWHATAECAPKMPQRAEGGGNLPSAASSRSVDGGDTGFRRCRYPGEAYSLTWTADPQPSRTTNRIVDTLTLAPVPPCGSFTASSGQIVRSAGWKPAEQGLR